mmetsp:Transcript_22879/g.41339  ORF Transcript_22879/g.41339 Transcript_22879/m.41339 type:complete len:268 (+) Transcript_22879:201-1004(+)
MWQTHERQVTGSHEQNLFCGKCMSTSYSIFRFRLEFSHQHQIIRRHLVLKSTQFNNGKYSTCRQSSRERHQILLGPSHRSIMIVNAFFIFVVAGFIGVKVICIVIHFLIHHGGRRIIDFLSGFVGTLNGVIVVFVLIVFVVVLIRLKLCKRINGWSGVSFLSLIVGERQLSAVPPFHGLLVCLPVSHHGKPQHRRCRLCRGRQSTVRHDVPTSSSAIRHNHWTGRNGSSSERNCCCCRSTTLWYHSCSCCRTSPSSYPSTHSRHSGR